MACNRWVAALALVGLLCFLAFSALLSLIFHFEHEQAAAIVGIVGNLCLLLAILNWAELRESPVNIYLCAKALFDSLYLTAFQGQYYNWSSTSYFLCIAEEQLNLFARQASVSIIIALIIERFLASMCPDECEKSPRISRLKVIVLFTMPALLWEFFLSITTYTDHQIMAGDFALVSQKCMHVQNGLRQISRFVYYMWNFFVPVLLFFLTNFLIAFKARYAPNANFIAIKDSGSRRSRRSSMVASGRCSTPPMESLAPFLFPLAFVLLNSPIYILYFTIPPTSPEFSQNAVQNMNIVARMLNDCYFALNLPLFALARVSHFSFPSDQV